MTAHEKAGPESEFRALAFCLTELICLEMEKQNVSRAELARRIGVSRNQITQTLHGTQNMTLRTIAEMFYHLGLSLDLSVRELDE